MLGQGAFGVVYLGLNTETGRFAIVIYYLCCVFVYWYIFIIIYLQIYLHTKCTHIYVYIQITHLYTYIHTYTGELMAVKQMAIEEVSTHELSSLENEINLLKSFRHPNIVRYIGTEITPMALSIFLEYVPGKWN